MNKGEISSKQSDFLAKRSPLIAYFSMEIGFKSEIPTYSGGLGVLAGDTIKAFADLNVKAIAITLLSRKGYFYQQFDENDFQNEKDYEWNPEEALEKTDIQVKTHIEGREVHIDVWKYNIKGVNGHEIPIYFLDTKNEKNNPDDQKLTDHLYGGDLNYRLQQEIILGRGGMKVVDALKIHPNKFHLNEGHAAFLITELYDELRDQFEEEETRILLKQLCSFTTHTPVPAGHDSFDKQMVFDKIKVRSSSHLLDEACEGNSFSITKLAMNNSSYINAVSRKHQQVTKGMFPQHKIDYVTNGVHSLTWTGKNYAALFDKYFVDWRSNPMQLRNALGIPLNEIIDAHKKAKQELIDFVNTTMNAGFSEETFTIGFARRATAYKRAELLFSDIERLKSISQNVGNIQIIFSGKAHPRDQQGKEIIQRIKKLSEQFNGSIKLVFLENYNMFIGHLLTSGVDIWLNTPKRPLEASGTSGMKAAHNGVPSLSVLDGWWIEGCIEGVTGWAINGEQSYGSDEEIDKKDAEDIYTKLEQNIIPLYYNDKEEYAKVMRNAIAINASYFNTSRMAKQYLVRTYIQN